MAKGRLQARQGLEIYPMYNEKDKESKARAGRKRNLDRVRNDANGTIVHLSHIP